MKKRVAQLGAWAVCASIIAVPFATSAAKKSAASASTGLPCEVRVIKKLQYGTGKTQSGSIPLTLDAYLPTTCNGKPVTAVPPIGVVHGGGFVSGTSGHMAGIAEYLAGNGFAAFSINYRLQGDKPVSETFTNAEMNAMLTEFVPQANVKTTAEETARVLYMGSIAAEDAIKAKEWVNANKNRFKLNTEKWGLIGGSAGAATVMNLAYGADDVFKKPQKASAVVDMWGDIPEQFIEAGEPPLLIIHGTEDETVPYERSTVLLNRAKQVGVPAERITGKGLAHVYKPSNIFVETVPGTKVTVIDAIVAFFNKNLR